MQKRGSLADSQAALQRYKGGFWMVCIEASFPCLHSSVVGCRFQGALSWHVIETVSQKRCLYNVSHSTVLSFHMLSRLQALGPGAAMDRP